MSCVKESSERTSKQGIHQGWSFVTLVKKGKQRKASFKSKSESSIDEPLKLLHMDLFGPVNIMSISKKNICLSDS